MTRTRALQTPWQKVPGTLALLSLVGLVNVELARAGDDAGVREFLAAESSRSESSSTSGQDRPASDRSSTRSARAFPRRSAHQLSRIPTRATFVSLPAEPAKRIKPAEPAKRIKVEKPDLDLHPEVEPDKQTKMDLRDPAQALLNDPTLKAGDIVVLHEGPKVFVQPGRFEDLRTSRLVPKGVRDIVLAKAKVPSRYEGGELNIAQVGEPSPSDQTNLPVSTAQNVAGSTPSQPH